MLINTKPTKIEPIRAIHYPIRVMTLSAYVDELLRHPVRRISHIAWSANEPLATNTLFTKPLPNPLYSYFIAIAHPDALTNFIYKLNLKESSSYSLEGDNLDHDKGDLC